MSNFSRNDAVELARKCIKQLPETYYAEPFMPHEWVIDAIIQAHKMGVLMGTDACQGPTHGIMEADDCCHYGK